MLRRLFIGLIILSALTAEGIMNTPWNIYNLCLYINSGDTLPDNSDKNLESLAKSLVCSSTFSDTVFENRLLVESDRIGQIKYNLPLKPLQRISLTDMQDNMFLNDNRVVLAYSFIDHLQNYYPVLNKDVVRISGTSPPAYC